MAAITYETPALQAQPVFLPASGLLPQQDRKANRQKYKNILFRLGLTEIILGIIFFVLNFASLGLAVNSYYRDIPLWMLSSGLWCSPTLIASGAVGMHTKKNSNMCMYNANMALSIISAVMMGIFFIFSVLSTILSDGKGLTTVQSLLTIGSFAAMIVCIVHSAYCCAGMCCTLNYYPGQVLYIPPQQLNNQQYVQLANGQYMLVQSQPLTGHQPTAAPATVQNAPSQQLANPGLEPAKVKEFNTVVRQEYPETNAESYNFPVTFDN